MGRYVASPSVFLMQSRLFSPGYAGTGRWVLFDAATRRAFSAAGRDVVPDVIRLMAMASGGATFDGLSAALPRIAQEKLTRLRDVGLLIPEEADGVRPNTFTALFQQASFDYPFHDYSARGARREERELLAGYARLWPAPASIRTLEGRCHPLPERSLQAGPPPKQGEPLDAETLGWVLQHSFGPVGEIKTRHVTCVRRTSPSGGARHPAEVGVVLSSPVGGLPPGTYVYDVSRHGLVLETSEVTVPGPDLAFIVRIRVERPMWRYRDLRALRPVLLDVGHIIETLALLLDEVGAPATVVSSPPSPGAGFTWLEEPPAAVLAVGGGPPRPSGRIEDAAADGPLLTSPAAVIRFADGRMVGQTVWPQSRETVLNESDYLILNHCVPSTRGDRVTTRSGITQSVPGTERERIDELVDSHLLLPAAAAEEFYRAAGLWVRHDWYLPLLAHLECMAQCRTTARTSGLSRGRPYKAPLTALASRRTTRAFSESGIPVAAVRSIASAALADMHTADALRWVRAFIAPLAVDGLSSHVHEWVDGDFKELLTKVTRDLVGDLASGQIPAAQAACSLWLVGGLDTDDPVAYELGLVELGRIGQRICLQAADNNIGVFLTPAVKDTAALTTLGVDLDPAATAYVFGLGLPRSRT